MELRIRIKPTKVVGPNKRSTLAKSQIGNLVFSTSTDFGTGYTRLTDNRFVYVYTSQKYRGKRGVRKAHWELYVYKFPVDLLKTTSLKVQQGPRTFKLVRAGGLCQTR